MDDITKMGLFFMSKDGKIVTISLQDLVDKYVSGVGSEGAVDLKDRTESKNDPDLFSWLGHAEWLNIEDKNLRAAGIFKWGDEGTLSMMETIQAKREGRSHILDPYKALRPASWGRYEMRPDGSYLMSYSGHRDRKLGRDYAKSKIAEKMGVSVSQVTGFDFVKKDSGKAERNGWRGSNGRTYRAAPVFEPGAAYDDGENTVIPGGARDKFLDDKAELEKAFKDYGYMTLGHGIDTHGDPADKTGAWKKNVHLFIIDPDGMVKVSDTLDKEEKRYIQRMQKDWVGMAVTLKDMLKVNPSAGILIHRQLFAGLRSEAVQGRVEIRGDVAYVSVIKNNNQNENTAKERQQRLDQIRSTIREKTGVRDVRIIDMSAKADVDPTRDADSAREPGIPYDDGENQAIPGGGRQAWLKKQAELRAKNELPGARRIQWWTDIGHKGGKKSREKTWLWAYDKQGKLQVINADELRTKMMDDGDALGATPTHLDWEEAYFPGLLAGAAHGRIDATEPVIRISMIARIEDPTFREQVKQDLAEYIGADVDKVKGYDFTGDGMPEVFEPGEERRLFSQGSGGSSIAAMSKEEIIAAAEEIFGRDVVKALIDSGLVVFAEGNWDPDLNLTFQEQIETSGAQGWAEKGKTYIMADAVDDAAQVKAIILHELGQHLGFGDDIASVQEFFFDMRERASGGDKIAQKAVRLATWAMLMDGRFQGAVSKIAAGKFSKYIKNARYQDFKNFDMSDADIDQLMDEMLNPAGNWGDDFDRQAFAGLMMEEVGAYVHNARASASDKEKAMGLWQKFLGFVRRAVWNKFGRKFGLGAFTTADLEIMAMSAVNRQAERGKSNEGLPTGKRFSLNAAGVEAFKATQGMDDKTKKPEEVVSKLSEAGGKMLTPGYPQAVKELSEVLRNLSPEYDQWTFSEVNATGPAGEKLYTADAVAAGRIGTDPQDPASEFKPGAITQKYMGQQIVLQRGMQYSGKKGLAGTGTLGEESGFGLAHLLKHAGAITARYAAIRAKKEGTDFKQNLDQSRRDVFTGIMDAVNYTIANAKHRIEYKDANGNATKVTLVDMETGIQVVLTPVDNVMTVRTVFPVGSANEGDDMGHGPKTIEKIANGSLDIRKKAEDFGKMQENLLAGSTAGSLEEFENKDDRRFSRSPQPAPEGEPSVPEEVGGDTQNPAPTSPPPLPPQPPAPVAPGAAPVNPEVSAWQRAWDVVTLRYFSGISVKAHQNARRFQGASIQAVADLIHNRPGSQGSAAPRSIPASIATARGKYTNRFRDIMAPLRDQLARMDTAAREAFYESLTDMITGRRNMGTGMEGQVADNLKKLLAELHAYRLAAGDELGEIQDYFPVVYNSDLITKSRAAFLADAEKAYKIELSSTMSGPELDAAVAASALALYNTHVRGMGAQEFGSLFSRTAPGGRENSSKERAFGRQAQNIMRKWQSNDPFLVITRYIGGAAKSAELARRFGADGTGWENYAKGMEADGVPQEVIEEMYQLVTQAAGVGTPGLGKAGQGFMDFVALYTAATSLGKSFMSNLFEPIAMGTRTGSPIYALRAYGETWTRSLNEFLKDVPIARMLAQESFWQQYGEHIGTIHNSLEDAWMTTHSMELGMDNQNPRMRWLTNRVYKANLMDATETAKQQASHALGHSYIGDLCKMISGSHWMNAFGMDASRSARQDLIELGVPESEHQAFITWMDALKAAKPQQRMDLMTDGSPMSKLYEEAQVRFTNQSSVRANRAHRPVFQDNLMGKMFLQLQSFSYSYAAEANSRIYDNLKRSAASGDYTMADRMRLIAPAMMLPLAIAAFAGMFKLRRELYPTEATMKRDNDPWWAQFVDAASYVGMFGPKVEQAMKFVMRDQPPGGIVGQHAINTARAAKGYATAAIGPDEKYDKAMASANKAAVKAAIPPVKGAIVAGASAINPLLGTAASVFANDTTLSNQAIEATQPEPPDKKRESKNPYNYRQPRPNPGK